MSEPAMTPVTVAGRSAIRTWLAAGLAAATMLIPQVAATLSARAETATIVEYPVPNPDPGFSASPNAIVRGPDGNLWFTETNRQLVSRITPAGVVTQFPVAGHPTGITVGPDGNLWFIEPQDKLVGRMSTDGTVLNQLPVPWLFFPQSEGHTQGITLGPDNHVWIADPVTNMIGWIDTTGAITAYTVSGGPLALTAGSDGNLWFSEYNTDKIAKLDPATGVVLAEYQVPKPFIVGERTGLVDIVAGPDAKLWFTESGVSQIGKLDPTTIVARSKPCVVLTHSLTLTHDIGPCAGAGIVIPASNITLNLNGHKVVAAPGPRFGDFPGIHLVGASAVTVTNGTVTGFDAGIAVDGGSGNTFTGLNVHHNRSQADPAADFGDGIVLFHSGGNRIMNNVIAYNGIYDGIGVLGLDSNNNIIRDNQVTNTTNRGYFGSEGEGTGIILNPFVELSNPRRGESISENNVINNLVTDNLGSGISSLSNVGGIIRGNIADRNGARKSPTLGNGIGVQALAGAIQSTRNLVDSNRARDNFDTGIQVLSDDNRVVNNTATGNKYAGIELFFAESNRVLNNTATGNVFFDLHDQSPDCDANIWRNNIWSGVASPPCTQVGGHQVPAPAAGSQADSQAPASSAQAQNPPTPVGRTRTALPAGTPG